MIRRCFLLSIPVTLAVGAALAIFDLPLRTDACPNGIISFEFATTSERAAAMVASWDAEARVFAGLSLGIDYLYLVAYGTTLGLGCLLLGQGLAARRPGFGRVGRWLAWGMAVAAACDAVENFALIRVLLGDTRELWPRMAAGFAIPKFAFVFAAMGFLIVGSGVRWLGRRV